MQYNINVANGTGLDVRTNLNLAHQSLATNFFGATDPSTMSPVCAFPGSTWLDTGNNQIKVRNANDSDWIVIGTIESDGTPKLGETAINTSELALNLRQPSTAYAVGDIAYSALLPSWAYLEATVAGTTDSGDLPVPATVSEGATFTDGTATWKIQSTTNKADKTLSNLDLANLANGVVVAQNLSENGYMKFSNGLMIQWLTVNVPVTAYTNNDAPLLLFNGFMYVSYPIAFTQGVIFGAWAAMWGGDSFAPLLQYFPVDTSTVRLNTGFIRMWGSQWSQGNTSGTSKAMRIIVIGC